MEKIIARLEKLKKNFKKDCSKEEMLEDIGILKKELECAVRSFNETTDDDYIDVAIMNLNLAKKKYELKLKEARAYTETQKAI